MRERVLHEYLIEEFFELATGEKQALAGALTGAEQRGWEVFAVLPSSTLTNTILIVLRKPIYSMPREPLRLG